MEDRSARPRTLLKNYLLLGAVALLLGTGYALVLWRSQSVKGSTSVLAAAADSQDAFAEVGPFALVDSRGAAVTRESLLGKPSIVGFIFTRCTGPCPRVTSTMKGLSGRIGGDAIRLVTITVDPEYDTPAILSEYARNVGADVAKWWFLTGPREAVLELSEKSFLLPLARDAARPVGESITHKTYLTVVDKRGHVRGYYDGESDAGADAALARARFLANEP